MSPEEQRAPHCPWVFYSLEKGTGWCYREGIIPVVIRIVSLRIYTGERGISLQKPGPPRKSPWAALRSFIPWHFAVGMLPAALRMEERGCCGGASPSPPSAPGLGEAGGGGPGGSPEPGGSGGGWRRSWPGRAVAAAAAAGAGQTAQPLPPGASLSSPRSWRLQNSLSLSATSLLPLPSLPPRPFPAESPAAAGRG